MTDLCLSRIVTSLLVSSWERLSLMMIGVSVVVVEKNIFQARRKGF